MRASATRSAWVIVLTALIAASCTDGGTGGSPSPSTSPTASSTPGPTATTTATSTPGATTSPTDVRQTVVSVYYLRGEKLQPVPRVARGTGVGAEALRALLSGPTEAERGAGFTSTVPTGTALRSLDVSGGLATVDLTGRFESGGGSLSMTARVAQVVFTLTRFPSVTRVAFRLDGRPVKAIGGEGVDVSRPVGRADYEDLSPAVLVEQPRWGERAVSPLRVSGTANVFEAVFFFEVRDAAGRVLRQQRVMASSGTGTRGTFDVAVPFSTVRPESGSLRAFTYSAKDGSRREELLVRVRLAS